MYSPIRSCQYSTIPCRRPVGLTCGYRRFAPREQSRSTYTTPASHIDSSDIMVKKMRLTPMFVLFNRQICGISGSWRSIQGLSRITDGYDSRTNTAQHLHWRQTSSDDAECDLNVPLLPRQFPLHQSHRGGPFESENPWA